MSKELRAPAVAGMFYPESAKDLAVTVGRLLDGTPGCPALRPKAIIAPHAGYIYSGPIAASIYASLTAIREHVRRVILLGPTHRVAINGLAMPTVSGFVTPLGEVPLDAEAAAAIRHLPQVVSSDIAHELEHSLEVQLPFLQAALHDFSIVPLAVGHASAEAVAEVLDILWGGPETLIVVSSDLSHYLGYDAARRSDELTARQIVGLVATLTHQQACGATPINGLLLAARRHGLHAEVIDLRNSGDTAGDKSRVVGYGAFAFTPFEHDPSGDPRNAH